jgi:soluble lytic murein transglycosylase-like protein
MKKILLIAAATAAIAAPSVRADIAIFTDGRTMKVSKYAVNGDAIQLTFAPGGSITLPLRRVERIVSDEVVPIAEVKAVASLFPARSWRFNEASKPLYDSRYNKVIVDAARKLDVDAALISSIIKAESDYDPRTISSKGARGLMQLMPATADRFGIANSLDPEQNIYGGARYLKWLLGKFNGNAELVVAAYNAGEGNVWKYDGVPPFRETVEYVRRVARPFVADAATAVVAETR